jgi:P-type Ca2+ transporter type 2C
MEGLKTSEVAARLTKFGYNELPSSKPKSIWLIGVDVMKEPMFLLLIGCSFLYMILGDYREGIIMLCSISIIIFITFYQYQKTEKALDALKKLASPKALVLRDGVEIKISSRELVPDDILILNEGDRISADAVLIDSLNLTVNESMLTGESIAVSKVVSKGGSESTGLVFSGTLIEQGKGKAKVIATGINTQFGKIGASLQSIEQSKTRLQAEMKILIRNLFIAGGFISVAVVLAFYFTRGNFVQSLLNGLAAAMAILPEEFPVVLTIFLALGAWRLSRKNVLTRNPSAIETLGSATTLCSDKTGTITKNKMEVAAVYNGSETFLKKLFLVNEKQIEFIIITAFYASQEDSIDSMEMAIGNTFENLVLSDRTDYKLIKEYPLSKELLAMTRVLKNDKDSRVNVNTKGAPEVIFKLCKLDETEKARHTKTLDKMAENGYRVIAVANAVLSDMNLPENQNGFSFKFLGLIGFEDPIRDEVPQAIVECKEAGIKVIMITGDYPATARSIASQIKLENSGLLTGEDLNKMSDEELRIKINTTTIFARVVPEQKLRIVKALKANNEIVAMTGDGVNDAPALKAADIGIAMGNKGTDVAREASSLVLLDDNFASIVSAIRSGRRIFDNLQKAMSYILAIHIPIIGLTMIPAFIPSLPLLLMPLHIIFMELIIDPVCSIAFESEQEEKNIMKRHPRKPDEQFFGKSKILSSVFQGLLLLAMVIIVYFSSVNEGHTDGEVRAIAFTSLIMGNVFLIITNLSKTRSFLAVIKEKNLAVIIILSIAITMLILVISIPILQQTFSFEFPGYKHFLSSFIGASSILFILEAIKFYNAKKYKLV